MKIFANILVIKHVKQLLKWWSVVVSHSNKFSVIFELLLQIA